MVTSSAADADVQVSYGDFNAGVVTLGRKNTAVAAAATTDITGSPAASNQRNIKHISIRNKHASTSQTITLQHVDGATTVEIFQCILAAGQHMVYDGEGGFRIYGTGGSQVTNYAVPTTSILGRITAGTGPVEFLTATQARTVMGLATTDTVRFGSLGVNMAPIAGTDINTCFRVSGNSTQPASGAGLEFIYQTGIAYLQVYDRGGSVYKPFNIEASILKLNPNSNANCSIGQIASGDPTNTLHVVGTSGTPSFRIGSTNLNYYWDLGRENATTGDFIFLTHENVAATEVMRLTVAGGMTLGTATDPGNGNIGLKAVPSTALNSVYSGLLIGNACFIGSNTIGTGKLAYMAANVIFSSGGAKYISTTSASYYSQQSGVHTFGSAPSGTAGNTISFVDALSMNDTVASFNVPVRKSIYTVATLPASPLQGWTVFVSDANATTFASVVAGGGANKVPVYHDGTNWRIG